MIELLRLGKQQGWDRLEHAVEQALSLRCTDAAVVRHLLSFGGLAHPPVESCALDSELECYQRPLPVLNEYDLLLGEAMTETEVVR